MSLPEVRPGMPTNEIPCRSSPDLRSAMLSLVICLTLFLSAALPNNGHAQLPDTITSIKPSIVMVGMHSAAAGPNFSLLGSGFAVGENLVATNAHVVSKSHDSPPGSQLVIRLQETPNPPQLRKATIVASDPVHDLSLLKVEGAALTPVKIGNSSRVREGDSVAFIGFPIGGILGFSPVTHRGIISAITSIAPPSQSSQGLTAQRIRAVRDGVFDVFQLDATAYPGNSGGPLFDPGSGQVLGIINMVFVKGTKESALTQPSGITYAIPADHLTTLIRESGAPAPRTN